MPAQLAARRMREYYQQQTQQHYNYNGMEVGGGDTYYYQQQQQQQQQNCRLLLQQQQQQLGAGGGMQLPLPPNSSPLCMADPADADVLSTGLDWDVNDQQQYSALITPYSVFPCSSVESQGDATGQEADSLFRLPSPQPSPLNVAASTIGDPPSPRATTERLVQGGKLDHQQVMRKACNQCTIKKRKCDGNGTVRCKQCRGRGVECIYSVKKKSKRRLTNVGFGGKLRLQGTLGFVENSFLDTFMEGFSSFLPLARESDIRLASMSICGGDFTKSMISLENAPAASAQDHTPTAHVCLATMWTCVTIGALLQGVSLDACRPYLNLAISSVSEESKLLPIEQLLVQLPEKRTLMRAQNALLRACLSDIVRDEEGFIACSYEAVSILRVVEKANFQHRKTSFLQVEPPPPLSLETAFPASSMLEDVFSVGEFFQNIVRFRPQTPEEWACEHLKAAVSLDMELTEDGLPGVLKEPLERGDALAFITNSERLFTVACTLVSKSRGSSSGDIQGGTSDGRAAPLLGISWDLLHEALLSLRAQTPRTSLLRTVILSCWLVNTVTFRRRAEELEDVLMPLVSALRQAPGLLRFSVLRHYVQNSSLIAAFYGNQQRYSELRECFKAAPGCGVDLPSFLELSIPTVCCQHAMCLQVLVWSGALSETQCEDMKSSKFDVNDTCSLSRELTPMDLAMLEMQSRSAPNKQTSALASFSMDALGTQSCASLSLTALHELSAQFIPIPMPLQSPKLQHEEVLPSMPPDKMRKNLKGGADP
jgi:hypothetical protein